jgi:hypothetical protein
MTSDEQWERIIAAVEGRKPNLPPIKHDFMTRRRHQIAEEDWKRICKVVKEARDDFGN